MVCCALKVIQTSVAISVMRDDGTGCGLYEYLIHDIFPGLKRQLTPGDKDRRFDSEVMAMFVGFRF